MRQLVLILSLFIAGFALGENTAQNFDDRVINLDHPIEEEYLTPAYYYGAYYPSYCSLYPYNCQTCYGCFGVSFNVALPFLPNYFWAGLQLRHRQMCGYQYQVCAWNTGNPYLCYNYYYACTGYTNYYW